MHHKICEKYKITGDKMKEMTVIRKLLLLVAAAFFFLIGNSMLYQENAAFFMDQVQEDGQSVNQTYSLTDVMAANDGLTLSENTIDTAETETGETWESSFDLDAWNLLLVNKQHPIPEDYEVKLGVIKGSMKCDERIIPELTEMMQDAKKDGITLVVCSPYRDMSRQDMLFNRKIKNYMRKNVSFLEAYKKTAQAVTIPGASEHQIGLALDIISNTYTALEEGFADTAAGKWLAAHCQDYGFILRYPKGKEEITGIEFEPWHFRYVGKDAAAIIMKKNLTLEEFVQRVRQQ